MNHTTKSTWASVSCAAIVSCSLTIAACHREAIREPASLPNVSVIDDHGRPVSLSSLKGKVVLLDFIHIGCPGVCATLVSKFGEVADSLKPELGSKVVLLSVTNDPEHDRPEQLLALARSSDADLDGWLFVTGKPTDVARVIEAFGVNNERMPDGSPAHITQVFLLGTDGQQKREYRGMLMKPQAVVSQIRDAITEVQGGAS
jgi:protein SCO1